MQQISEARLAFALAGKGLTAEVGRGCMGRAGAPISVLVVEDEVLISNIVADALSASGFVVHGVTTADEAL